MKHLCILLAVSGASALHGYQLRPISDIPVLVKSLSDPNPQNRWTAVKALRDMGPLAKEAVPALIECLKDPALVRDAELTLAAIGPSAKAAAPAFIDLLPTSGDDMLIRQFATQALKSIGPEARDALPKLIELANGTDGGIRTTALEAITEIAPPGEKQGFAALLAALSDPDEDRRWRAVLGLWESGQRRRRPHQL